MVTADYLLLLFLLLTFIFLGHELVMFIRNYAPRLKQYLIKLFGNNDE